MRKYILIINVYLAMGRQSRRGRTVLYSLYPDLLQRACSTKHFPDRLRTFSLICPRFQAAVPRSPAGQYSRSRRKASRTQRVFDIMTSHTCGFSVLSERKVIRYVSSQ